jgi:hypothetical protein
MHLRVDRPPSRRTLDPNLPRDFAMREGLAPILHVTFPATGPCPRRTGSPDRESQGWERGSPHAKLASTRGSTANRASLRTARLPIHAQRRKPTHAAKARKSSLCNRGSAATGTRESTSRRSLRSKNCFDHLHTQLRSRRATCGAATMETLLDLDARSCDE